MARKPAAASTIVKLIVGAGQASPSPPVGPALGSKGVKSMDFCKEFNAMTSAYHPGTPIPVRITVRPDRTFTFTLRTPPTSTLLLAAAGAAPGKGSRPRGANAPGRIAASTPVTPETARGGKSLLSSAGLGARVTAGTAGAASAASSAARRKDAAQSAAEAPASEVGQGVAHAVAKTAGGDRAAGAGGGQAQVGEVSLKHCFEIARIKRGEARLGGLSLEGLVRSVVAQARSIGVGVVP